MRPQRAVIALVVAVACSACSALVSFSDLTGSAGVSDAASDAAIMTTDGAVEVGACTADLTRDPTSCGACGHDCLGGACNGGTCGPVLLYQADAGAHGRGFFGVAIAGGTLFVSDPGDQNFSAIIFSGASDGGGIAPLISGGNGSLGLATDSNNLYWSNSTDGQLWTSLLDGTNVTGLTVNDTSRPCVALHPTTLAPYTAHASKGTITRIDGKFQPKVLVTGEPSPTGVAVSESAIFWTNTTEGTVMTAALDGSGKAQLYAGPSGAECMATSGNALYWANSVQGSIIKLDLGTHAVSTVIDMQLHPHAVAIAGGALYYTTQTSVRRLALP